MSFRNRLTLFFIVIVIVPMIAVMVVLFRLVSETTESQANARLGQAQRGAQAEYGDARATGAEAAALIGSAPDLASAIRARDRAAIRSELAELARRSRSRRVRADLDGLGRFEVGGGDVVAPAMTRLVDARNRPVGRLEVGVVRAQEYVTTLARQAGLDVVLSEESRVLATSVAGIRDAGALPPDGGALTVGGRTFRVATFADRGWAGTRVQTWLLVETEKAGSPFRGTTGLVSGALVGFLLAAFAFAITVSRSLQAQVQRLLDAARRLGRGEFGIQLPTEGNDEFAALGSEFNAMARELESRLEELQQERARLQGAIRRVGESFAKGLDRDALLDLVVQSAVDGVGADCGRATVLGGEDGPPQETARAGDLVAHEDALHAVESEVLRTHAPAEAHTGGAHALAHPLRATEGAEILGLISVARATRPFTDPDRDLLAYLANQAAVSIANVDLHETVQRQAVTDELTGLFNHRRFQEVMALEVERARRFGSDMGLIMLDIDDFKQFNDTYGHLQGDMVLREVAEVLRDSAREIDEPARYGGEEMAVALPQTDLEGAYQFAERVRRRIEALELPIIGGDGTLKVTASFGAGCPAGRRPGPRRGQGGAGRRRRRRALPGQTLREEQDGPRGVDCVGSMGLLDDAIREHLELKRRHGAAEEEVRRQEQEALGPPRRGEVPEPLAPPATADEPLADGDLDEAPADEAPRGPAEPPPGGPAAYAAPPVEPSGRVAPEPEPEPVAGVEPAAEPQPAPEGVYEDEPWLDEEAPADPAGPSSSGAVAAGPGDPEGEDVLEETPEFLQETPEHDRLWFEQKPPKDFDFDK
jgi:diguanylate cyclase (GGDEF)-like protein